MNPNKTDTSFSKNSLSTEEHQELIKSWDKDSCIMSINSHQFSVEKKNLDKNNVELITKRSPDKNLESKYNENFNTQEIKLSSEKNIGKI